MAGSVRLQRSTITEGSILKKKRALLYPDSGMDEKDQQRWRWATGGTAHEIRVEVTWLSIQLVHHGSHLL